MGGDREEEGGSNCRPLNRPAKNESGALAERKDKIKGKKDPVQTLQQAACAVTLVSVLLP